MTPTTMNRTLSALFFGATLAVAALPAATAQDVTAPSEAHDLDTIVARMQAAYDGLEDFTAQFTQEYTNQTLDETTRSSGVVHFMRPGRMRWDYLEPSLRLFVSDGASLWIYEPAQAQYWTQPLGESDLPTALRFLMGEGNLADDFEITLDRRSTPERPTLNLTPRRSEGQYTRLRLVLDPTTWFVAETTIYDPAGNTNRLRFVEPSFNVGYLPGDFAFEPPAGVTRIDTPTP